MPGIVAYTSIISQCGVGQERVSLLLFSFTANRNRKSRRAARRQKKGTAAAGCCQSALTGRMGVTLRLSVTPAENQSVNGEDVCVCVYVYTLVGEVKFYLFLSLGRAKVTAPVDVG